MATSFQEWASAERRYTLPSAWLTNTPWEWARGGDPEPLQLAGVRQVGAPGPLTGSRVEGIDAEPGTGIRRQSAQGVDAPARSSGGECAPHEWRG